MESTLAIQQFIQQKIRRDFTDIEGILELPLKVDVNVWNYEHLRYYSPSFESSVGGSEKYFFPIFKNANESPKVRLTGH